MTIFKTYISNLSPLWPMSRQEVILNGVEGTKYRDELDASERRGFRLNGLEQRDIMLRRSSRHEDQVIQVASLACLARNSEDLMLVLTNAAERNATVRDMSAKFDIKPNAKAKDLQKAAILFADERKRAAEKVRGETGGRKSGQLKSAQAKAIAMKYEKDWVEHDKTNQDIAAESGISVNTLKLYLGRRKEARTRHHAAMKRAMNAYNKRGSAKNV